MSLITPDLRTDAIAEVRRLTRARAFQRDAERVLAGLEGTGPLVMRSRRNTVRQAVGRRVVLVWRVSCEDGSGRQVESHLIALVVDIGPTPSASDSRVWIRALLQGAKERLRQHVELAAAAWLDALSAVTSEFTSARIRRAHAIAGRLETERPQIFQAGLFDSRAERAHNAGIAGAAERHGSARARATAAEKDALLTARPPELLLVLTP